MYVSFEQLPDTSRVWVYQAEKKLVEQEVAFVANAAEHFLRNWQAHGQDLKASFRISHNQFLILAVDESHSPASGCSIDASVHLIKKIEQELKTSFTTHGKVAFLIGGEIQLKPFNQIKRSITDQEISADTVLFDNTIQTLSDFKLRWQIPGKATWVNRYF